MAVMEQVVKKKEASKLRFGWTTGACATAAMSAAYRDLVGVPSAATEAILLPKGRAVSFAVAYRRRGSGWAEAGIIKDAGDDPDVTHGALIIATVRFGLYRKHEQSDHETTNMDAGDDRSIAFIAGDGVGVVSRRGLPIDVGAAAINPVPRQMMRDSLARLAAELGGPATITVTISIPGGAELAQKTWNPRLGIIGGLSILGTTGIVRPYSCSAWIHAIHRGVDVARADGLTHIAAATGSRSELAAQQFYGLPVHAMIDMGDFAGGFLRYVRRHPVRRVTLAGGIAKLAKFAQGNLDLHSSRSRLDFAALATDAMTLGADPRLAAVIGDMTSLAAVLDYLKTAHPGLADLLVVSLCDRAAQRMDTLLKPSVCASDVIAIDRAGVIIGQSAARGD